MKKNAGTLALHLTHLLAVEPFPRLPAAPGVAVARRHGDHVRVGAELARNPRRLVLAREVVAPEGIAGDAHHVGGGRAAAATRAR